MAQLTAPDRTKPTKLSSKPFPIVLVLVSLFTPLLLLLIGIIAGAVFWFSAGARETSHTFLSHARRGDCVSAFKSASKSLQARVPQAEFCAYLDQEAPDAKGRSGEEIVNLAGGFDSWCVEAKLHGVRLHHPSVYLIVVKEGNGWKVDQVSFDEPADCKSPD